MGSRTVRSALAARLTMTLALAATAAPLAAQADPYQATLPPAQVQVTEAGRQALRRGETAEAEGLFRQVLAENSDAYRAQYNLGLVLLKDEKLPEAVSALERAREIRERLALPEVTIYNSLGWALYLNGDLEKAEGVYLEGTKHVAENSLQSNQKLFNNLGALYLRTGRLDDAQAAFVRARDEFGSEQAVKNLELVASLRRSQLFVRARPLVQKKEP